MTMRSALILMLVWLLCVKSTKQTIDDASNQSSSSNSTCNQQAAKWCSEWGGFMCYHGDKCVHNSNLCDGVTECEDGSDELNCGVQSAKGKGSTLSEEGARMSSCADAGIFVCRPINCEPPICIPMNVTCNGIKDCPFGEDEGEWCSECDTKSCEQACENTPYGAHCNCHLEGFELSMDGISCQDIDECSTGVDVCQQLCENTVGSFICKCASGYELEGDGQSCRMDKSIDPKGYLLVSSGEEVSQVPLLEYRNEFFYALTQKRTWGKIESLDYFRRENTIVITIQTHDNYHGRLAVSQNGKLTVLRDTTKNFNSLSVDWIGSNVFLTMEGRNAIFVCSSDGRFCRKLVKSESRSFRDIVVHPSRGLILWIDHRDSYGHKILMSNMDGSNVIVRVLIEENIKDPRGLTVDHIRNDVYFADAARHVIERINIDTKRRSVVVSHDVSQQSEMIFFNGFLYWTEQQTRTVNVFNVVRKEFTTRTIRSNGEYRLALNHSLYQPEPASNPCSELDCPWICVAVPGTNSSLIAKCLCPDGYEESRTENTCIPPPKYNETNIEIDDNEWHYGFVFERMLELCRTGMGCSGKGNCRELYNSRAELNSIICDCPDLYDGVFCERLNNKTEKLAGIEVDHGWNELVLLVPTITLIVVVIGALISSCFVKWKPLCGNGSEQNKSRASDSKGNSFISKTTSNQEPKFILPSSYDNHNYPNAYRTTQTSLQSTASPVAEVSL